jgi:hypothetical protein
MVPRIRVSLWVNMNRAREEEMGGSKICNQYTKIAADYIYHKLVTGIQIEGKCKKKRNINTGCLS